MSDPVSTNRSALLFIGVLFVAVTLHLHTTSALAAIEIPSSSSLWHLAGDYADASDNNNDASGVGTPSFSSSSAPAYNGSIALNGSSQYVDAPGNASTTWNLDFTTSSYTIGAWAYLDTGIADYATLLAASNGTANKRNMRSTMSRPATPSPSTGTTTA
jgi:hypothetical protein